MDGRGRLNSHRFDGRRKLERVNEGGLSLALNQLTPDLGRAWQCDLIVLVRLESLCMRHS